MTILKSIKSITVAATVALTVGFGAQAQDRQKIETLYIPLADHYAAVVAYEKYRDQMTKADLNITMMKSLPSIRGKFMSKQADLAILVSPLAMNMHAEDPTIKWVSLIHRNGNALAVNKILADKLNLAPNRKDRKPSAEIAEALKASGNLTVGVPGFEATHTLVLYKFLKDHGVKLAIGNNDGEVIARPIAPPKSPNFLAAQSKRNIPAAFEQSLPWADVVETSGKGKVAWYSKDVLKSERGHVECIIIAQSDSVASKGDAIKEVIYYMHKAGKDIEAARLAGPEALKGIASMVRKHIPAHTEAAILASLDKEIDAISYSNLNVDKPGLKRIMDLALEAGTMKSAIDINAFADDSFSTEITDQ